VFVLDARIIKAMLAEGKAWGGGVQDGVLRLYAFTPVSYMVAPIYTWLFVL